MDQTCQNPNSVQPEIERPNPSQELIPTKKKKKNSISKSELDKLAKDDLSLEVKQKIVENPKFWKFILKIIRLINNHSTKLNLL